MSDIIWPKPQPIETAPKDGTRILAFDGTYGWELVCFEDDSWIDIFTSRHDSTHWLPLPPDPE